MAEQSCFVISPIGEDGGEIRHRADQVFRHIIQPVLKECGYAPIRADQISKPGMITNQIVDHILEDDLVIADLAGHNPNVFYELAVRHATGKPIILLTAKNEQIPFDVSQNRAIFLDHRDLDSVAACKEELSKQIRGAEADTDAFANPISAAINLKALGESGNPLEESYANMMVSLDEIRRLLNIQGVTSNPRDMDKNEILCRTLILQLNKVINQLNLSDNEIDYGVKSLIFDMESIILKSSSKLTETDLHSEHPDWLPF